MVYAAQPREGTETLHILWEQQPACSRFMQLNPARGRKRLNRWDEDDPHTFIGLCSSTPRGDGN